MRGGGADEGVNSRKHRTISRTAPGLLVVGEGSLAEVEGVNTPTLWNVPNILTLARLICVPILGFLFYAPIANRNIWCAALFAGAAITDWLDGWWARKFNIASPFGAFLDPVADKLIVAVAMILLSERLGEWMTVCTSIILCREIAVSALREWMAQIGARGVVKVGMAGKCKTAAQMVALTTLLLLQPSAAPAILPPVAFDAGKWLMIFSAVLTVTSGTGYLQAAWPALMGKDAHGK
ncbi:CDP-diacylglycerol--glycerol-3-phosphate 3-phosphatidyltransferase [Tribonema minus]|uniref:CDP-diacylglycerol--glycerol-3-phosphate 3-phosphatidyltransferase n=1 Tax=Tribonema minus TaxID=303371 RepID=A0A835ZDG0_9STRA|nr:CDP-diacylglycerol--glycerol-3-phosphate 3-phosphatidyltransferase [Tribonema minus]